MSKYQKTVVKEENLLKFSSSFFQEKIAVRNIIKKTSEIKTQVHFCREKSKKSITNAIAEFCVNYLLEIAQKFH